MARSGGLEPPTAWFVAMYSIQLSYERVLCNKLGMKHGALGRTRTSNRLVRSQVLYPVELRAQTLFQATLSIWRRGRDSNPR